MTRPRVPTLPSVSWQQLGHGARREAGVTWRMLADNLQVILLPPLVFTLGACFHARLPAHQVLWHLGQITALALFYGYVFDTSNQAHGADEDRLNEPYRPVPAGRSPRRESCAGSGSRCPFTPSSAGSSG